MEEKERGTVGGRGGGNEAGREREGSKGGWKGGRRREGGRRGLGCANGWEERWEKERSSVHHQEAVWLTASQVLEALKPSPSATYVRNRGRHQQDGGILPGLKLVGGFSARGRREEGLLIHSHIRRWHSVRLHR